MDEARERAGEVTDQVQNIAGETAEKFKRQADSSISHQKIRAAGGVESIAHAVRQTSQQLREQDQGTAAEYADRAAMEMERFSSYLREADVSQLVGEVEGFARRQPIMFLGGALLLGFMGARFLKSTGQRGAMAYPPAQYGRDSYDSGLYRQGTSGRFGSTASSVTGSGTVHREPAAFRPRGPVSPVDYEEEDLEPEIRSGDYEDEFQADDLSGTLRTRRPGDTPSGTGTTQAGSPEDLEDR